MKTCRVFTHYALAGPRNQLTAGIMEMEGSCQTLS